jgi:uncharacterized protein YllA (UPF0747 family)
MSARLRELAHRRAELVARSARDRVALADASRALVAPLAVAEIVAAAAHDLRRPPARLTLAGRAAALLVTPKATRVVRWAWGAFVLTRAALRAVRAVRSAERTLR